jgi:hypothetical protein
VPTTHSETILGWVDRITSFVIWVVDVTESWLQRCRISALSESAVSPRHLGMCYNRNNNLVFLLKHKSLNCVIRNVLWEMRNEVLNVNLAWANKKLNDHPTKKIKKNWIFNHVQCQKFWKVPILFLSWLFKKLVEKPTQKKFLKSINSHYLTPFNVIWHIVTSIEVKKWIMAIMAALYVFKINVKLNYKKKF